MFSRLCEATFGAFVGTVQMLILHIITDMCVCTKSAFILNCTIYIELCKRRKRSIGENRSSGDAGTTPQRVPS
jgi:hypothetical protein